MKQINIYALINPLNGQVFYVGATSQKLTTRLSCHITDSRHGVRPTKKEQVIMDLIGRGVSPEIFELDKVNIQEASFFERFYIDLFLSFGFNLFQNHSSVYSIRKKASNCKNIPAPVMEDGRVSCGNSYKEFGSAILRLRLTSGLTQKEAAEKIGVQRSAYTKWEAGTENISLDTCNKIAEAFGAEYVGDFKFKEDNL